MGVEIHESPRAAMTNDKPLPAGAVISAEPGIYLPGRFGVRIEDVLIIQENGCKDIMEAPKEEAMATGTLVSNRYSPP